MSTSTGVLRGIFVDPVAAGPVHSLVEARVVVGRGIEGDRYFLSAGSFSRWPGTGRPLTLIDEDEVAAVAAAYGIDLSDGRHRRNLVTRGIALDQLVGVRFRIGDLLLRGERLCLPCKHLERLTEPGVYEALKHRGGLRAEVLEDAVIRLGDAVVPCDSAKLPCL
jgi:MOSC domain-containing protein YiiM